MVHPYSMKVTFELPPSLVQRLAHSCSERERSRFVARLIAKGLDAERKAFEQAARKANTFHSLTQEMGAWEALNESID